MVGENPDILNLFNEALSQATLGERAKFLDDVCHQDVDLRARINDLLRAHDDAGRFLGGASATHLEAPRAEQIGATIGPYEILGQIGEGGFGVVFLAEQATPIRRRVALKIVKPGMDTRQVIARFEAERQALALMDHPGIAKVFDAGVTKQGRSYFVMELVQGVPITEYCDECNLPTRERLSLFIAVCQAVQHAHQKGIIHRDLKPTNVLVAMQDGRPVPKIIDFGVAKAIEQRLTEHTLTTAFAQMVGTPLYMSPEQAELSPLGADTRSDIYSLGVLLYELLTDTTPFDKDQLNAASYDEMRRIIREEEPPRPSTRLSTLAAERSTTIAEHHRTDARRLRETIGGDLDWIVMKCLEKDRNRRYETAAALAADVDHYLKDEPVAARPPSRVYRAGKFFRRNQWPVIAGAAILCGLVAGIAGMTIALVSQSRQRAAAERERAQAQLNLATELHAQGRLAKAETYFRSALRSAEAPTREDRQRAAAAQLRLAQVVYERGNPVEAERMFREAIAAYRASFPPGDPAIAHAEVTYALLLRTHFRFEEAEELFRDAYEIYRNATPEDHRATGTSATNLANVLITLRRYESAEPVARRAVAELKLTNPVDLIALAFARLELGRDLIALNRFQDAEYEVLEAERILTGTDHFHIGMFATVALYSSWNQAEPGKGYDAQAERWMHKLVGTYIRLEEFWPEDRVATEVQAAEGAGKVPP